MNCKDCIYNAPNSCPTTKKIMKKYFLKKDIIEQLNNVDREDYICKDYKEPQVCGF